MRILSLTAGAAGMYCGTCMRDNALAAELIRQGHDVLLVPFYTPTLTDEQNVSHDKVFFGGISVYLQQHFPIFRSLPAWTDKLWDSKWLLKLTSKGSIQVDPNFLGEMTVSMLRGEKGNQRKEIAKLTDWLQNEPRPDLIDLPYSLLIGLAQPVKRALGAPVCCTLQGEDLFLEGLQEPWRTDSLALIRAQLEHVDTFIAVSEYYADFMSSYLGIARERIQVSPLGINLQGHARTDRVPGSRLRVGYFARIAPEKGLHVLVAAIAELGDEVELEAAGYLPQEHRQYLEDLQRKVAFRYHGALDREAKIRFLQSVDVLSVPTPYAEPKGIFLFEAMANGVPVVQPRRGAYPEIIAKTQGGLLVEPDDPHSLADAFRLLARDADLRRRLAENAYRGVREHYTVTRMAERTLQIYRSVNPQVRHVISR